MASVAVVVVLVAFYFCRSRKNVDPTILAADPVDEAKNRSRSNDMIKSTPLPTKTQPMATSATKSPPQSPNGAGVVIDSTFSAEETELEEKFMYETITVNAPAGQKMGLQIDKKEEGMVVSEVKPGSMLENKVFIGDIIVGINDVDIVDMSPLDFKLFLVDTEEQERTFKIIREVDDSTHC